MYFKSAIITLVITTLAITTYRLAVYLFETGHIKMNYPPEQTFPIRGIDISHHQGKINWVELSQEKIDFIFIKATEGINHVDRNFKKHWEASLKNNYTVSAYHFFRFCKSGALQAENFIRTVPKIKGTLPPVVDIEVWGMCDNVSKTKKMAHLTTFLQKITTHYGVKPIIYTHPVFHTKYLKELNQYKLWICSTYSYPNIKRPWSFWQYSHKGTIKGIQGFVDLNVFQGTQQTFDSLIQQ